ncbi:hypothetical protein HYC85_028327 [Camellia sinensis]|uniref:Uncharacterized protein n=1 Tax=Camellia sinensis TaxID=4442 RepID=A0A7J7FYU5_CAMSI|nr:hypothetical protein HYC85_028327 [Camellia sinensis]
MHSLHHLRLWLAPFHVELGLLACIHCITSAYGLRLSKLSLVWHDIVCTVRLKLVQLDEPHRYCILRSSALSKMGRLWALTFTPVIVMTFEFCQRGTIVDTPFLTVLKTGTSPLEHLVITLVCVRLEFPEVSGMPYEASPHITGHGLRPPASDFMPSAMYIAGTRGLFLVFLIGFELKEATRSSFVKEDFKAGTAVQKEYAKKVINGRQATNVASHPPVMAGSLHWWPASPKGCRLEDVGPRLGIEWMEKDDGWVGLGHPQGLKNFWAKWGQQVRPQMKAQAQGTGLGPSQNGKDREFKVSIKFAAKPDIHHLQEFMRDMSARAFYEPILVTDFVAKYFDVKDLIRPLSDQECLKNFESAINKNLWELNSAERVVEMGHFSSLFNGLARSFSIKNGQNSGYCGGSESAESMVKESKKNELILRSSGTVHVNGSNNFASVFSKRGEKGVNQDCFIVWEIIQPSPTGVDTPFLTDLKTQTSLVERSVMLYIVLVLRFQSLGCKPCLRTSGLFCALPQFANQVLFSSFSLPEGMERSRRPSLSGRRLHFAFAATKSKKGAWQSIFTYVCTTTLPVIAQALGSVDLDPRATNHASRCMMAEESNCTTQYEMNAHINTTRPKLHHG